MPERLRTRVEEVTSRQLEVARLVAEGRTNPEIASSLGITLDGAKYHVSELLGRLGLERREEIAYWYRSERRGQRMRRFSALFASAPRAFATAAGATAVIALGVLFAVGLSGGLAQESAVGSPTPTTTPSAVASEPGDAPPVGAVGDASNMPQSLEGLPFILGQRLRSEAPEVVSWERVDWTTGCFDIDVPGGCPLSVSPVPGYRVVMNLDGEEYIARTGLEVGRYALEAAPPIAPFEVVYQWTGTAGDTDFYCLDVQLAEDGTGSIAGCGEQATPVDLGQSGVGSVEVLNHLRSAATYEASSSFDPSLQRLYVRGTVVEPPGLLPRAATEWGRYLAIESYTGHSSASMALAIGWRDDNADGCTNVQVEQYGVAYLSGCPEGSDGRLFLDDGQLAQLYGWLDGYRPFELPGAETYLVFSGDGPEAADDAVKQEILDWLRSPPWAPTTDVE